MSNPLPSPPRAPVDAGMLAGWIGGGLALFGGLDALGLGMAIVGVLLLAGALAALPPLVRAIAGAIGIAIPGWMRLGVFVVAMFAAASLYFPGTEKPSAAPAGMPRAIEHKPQVPSAPATAPAPTADAPAAKVLLDIKGTGTKSTEKFSTTARDWDLRWSYDCTGIGMTSDFIVRVVGDDGTPTSMGTSQLGGGGEDTDHFHQGGTFYLEVASGCRWHIVASDAR
jgi:hypothetical protein